MSGDPRSKFERFLFYPNSTFKIRKVTKFLVEKLSTSEVISKKPHRGGEWVEITPPQCPKSSATFSPLLNNICLV